MEQKNSKHFTYALIISISLILLFIAIFFISKAIYTPHYETYTSKNNFVFVKKAGLWNTQWQNKGNLYNIHFHFNPSQVENISIYDYGFNLSKFNTQTPVYITFDPSKQDLNYIALAASELSLNLARALKVPVAAACTENKTGCHKRPIKTCNSSDSVIYLKEENETAIILKNTCIIIQGKGLELTRAVDKLLFNWFRIN